ncbi:hypothetical protein [Novosphingobium sp.]|uniref:hypothetical protein n=1 Tax=Novosphingobium sp. TaxID=1874826 RepID=UPI00261164A4|nr:hypothetical protein [Novosphingobium sp.]
MSADRAKLKRLRRLERLRAITRQTALGEAAKAETTLAQVITLEARTAALITAYAARRDAIDGGELQRMQQFIAGLTRIADTTAGDLARARSHADARAAEAAEAERRRAAVEDRVSATQQRIARKAAESATPAAAAAKGAVGTALE